MPAGPHRLDEQVDVGLVDRAAAERKLSDETIDRRLVSAKDEGRQGMRGSRNSGQRLVQARIGYDRQNRPEDFIVHDLVVP
jgi:hypothetical protein